MWRFVPNDAASCVIIDILFFHCSFVDMLNIISTYRDILCVDINVDKRCVDHSTTIKTKLKDGIKSNVILFICVTYPCIGISFWAFYSHSDSLKKSMDKRDSIFTFWTSILKYLKPQDILTLSLRMIILYNSDKLYGYKQTVHEIICLKICSIRKCNIGIVETKYHKIICFGKKNCIFYTQNS